MFGSVPKISFRIGTLKSIAKLPDRKTIDPNEEYKYFREIHDEADSSNIAILVQYLENLIIESKKEKPVIVEFTNAYSH